MLLFLARHFAGTTPDPETQSYLKHLKAEYHAIPPETLEEKQREAIEKILQPASGDTVTWNDLFELELLLLEMLPPDKLLRKAWMIRERYREAAGPHDFAEYESSKPPQIAALLKDGHLDAKEEKQLRADLEIVLQDLFWRYRLRTIWEEARRNLFRKFGAIYALTTALGAGAVWALYWFAPVPVLWKAVLTLAVVILAGAAGGFVSLLKRLDEVPTSERRTSSLIQMEHGSTSLVLQSLLTGGIFALLILLMFGSGLLAGSLFPSFAAADTGVLVWLAGALATSKLFAQVVLWSFLAGFAERLVPDLLDTLAKRQSLSQPAPQQVK